ncbi:ABC transporter permease [Paenibacillus antri]|uniref:ABC transporter permease n=1 Tax=Paenibacillus antri TaxID=2582848 RepID=A0A5R9G8G9_9BACL|nr:ABC transporter permease [Paenibacillus antri]TLS50390.1 ABC transporter permease [Paenibacillus antri]
MIRLRSALLFDARLQARHGFYAAYAIVSLLYVAMLRALPEAWRELAHLLATFSDPAALGFYFVGGLVLLEKQQRLFDPLFATPYAASEYVLSKTATLTGLSAAAIVAVRLGAFGFEGRWALFLYGSVATAAFFTLLGLGIAVSCRTLNGYFVASTVYTSVFALPLVEPLGLASWPALSMLPTHASLLALESAFGPEPTVRTTIYVVVWLAGWTVAAYAWALRRLTREREAGAE